MSFALSKNHKALGPQAHLSAVKFATLFLLLAVSFLWAHAILLESNPSPNGTVRGSDLSFRLKFNSRVDLVHSRIYLDNGASSRAVRINLQDSPDVLVGRVGGLVPGRAVLRWQVLALDGHITRGELPFKVE
jgi:methionine-rich copper-binding protein CopC